MRRLGNTTHSAHNFFFLGVAIAAQPGNCAAQQKQEPVLMNPSTTTSKAIAVAAQPGVRTLGLVLILVVLITAQITGAATTPAI
ncbi:MAG: hypothetical protein VX501_00625 [Pseudomonadota bacterium]|nr:hypothetical protein [Pseudomonadota bacterium]